MTEKHRVLFVLPSLEVGGAERQLVELVNRLDTQRFIPTIFTFGTFENLSSAVRRDRVKVINVPRRFKLDTQQVGGLARAIRSERAALVHCTLQISLLMAMAAIRRSGCRPRVIDAIHTTKNRGLREEMADRVVYLPLMRRCDRVITVCDTQRRHWAAKYPSIAPKMTTVHNGIDLERYHDDVPEEEKQELRQRLGIQERDLVLGIVAAIRPEKEHAGVLEALARVVRMGHRAKLLVVGGAAHKHRELARRLRRRCTELKLDDYVRWLGTVPDPKPILSVLHATVLFSTSTETFPLALLESLAMGKPVVSSRIGGIAEIVEHKKNGFLVPVADVDAFASALAHLDSDRQLLAALSRAAPSSVARFSVDRMVRATEEVMLEVLEGGAPRQAPEDFVLRSDRVTGR